MITRTPFLIGAMLLASAAATASDAAWTLSGEGSRLNFMSVKAGDIAESHTFGEMDGSISPSGAAELRINLDTVDTGVDIRNERMRQVLFHTDRFPVATIRTQVDMAAVAALAPGESLETTVASELSLSGTDCKVNAELRVTRISDTKVQVVTAQPIILNAAALGLDAGVEKLRKLAGLPTISLTVPVDFSLTFEADDKVAAK